MVRLTVLWAAVCAALCSPLCAESLVVPATMNGSVLSSPLAAGVTYEFVVTGRYQFTPGFFADGEWINDGGQEYYGPYVSPYDFGESNDLFDLVINDASVSWLGATDGINWAPHRYSPSHAYKYYYTGTGSAVKFQICDGPPFYPDYMTGDNAGSLTVEINAVPEPTSLGFLALAGAGITARLVRRRRR